MKENIRKPKMLIPILIYFLEDNTILSNVIGKYKKQLQIELVISWLIDVCC